MNFCNYCNCEQCKTGIGLPGLTHAPTDNGHFICDVCYKYDECVRQKRESGTRGGPCDNLNCEHRPTIIGEWTKVNA